MIWRRIAARAVLIMVLFASIACRRVLDPEPAVNSMIERRRQIVTVHNMRLLGQLVRLHREDHGKDPASLDGLVRAYESDLALTKDGWGRELYYYSTGSDFVLASFGKDGVPISSRCAPGCIAGATPPSTLYDIDIVMINGEWAQTPADVDRY
jgi:hypothetical protein